MATSPSLSAAPSLAELLERCQQQEPAAQWALYQRFAGPMLTVARRYAPSVADAEDALQDAFVKIFQKLADQRDPAAFPGWVRRIVVSTAIDAWHKRRLRRADFDLDDAHHVAAPEASALEQLALAEVKALIDHLPAGCRLVLLLHTVEGYSHAEIAGLLSISEGTSAGQLSRARQRLTALVQQAGHERRPAPTASRTASPTASRTAPPATVPAALPTAPFHPLTALLFQ